MSKCFQYPVLLTPAEEGGYVVTCRNLPQLVTQGEDEQDALAQAAESEFHKVSPELLFSSLYMSSQTHALVQYAHYAEVVFKYSINDDMRLDQVGPVGWRQVLSAVAQLRIAADRQ
jgi:hypothetical protein